MRSADVALTALAVVIWGTTYLVTTELLPPGYPLVAALFRAAGGASAARLGSRTAPAESGCCGCSSSAS